MHHAAQSLVGKYEFTGFCTAGAHGSCTIREIFEAEVTCSWNPMPGFSDPEESQLVRVRLRGSGFLKHMVRRISGRLKRIGERHLPVNALTATLESGDSEGSFPKAPASGL